MRDVSINTNRARTADSSTVPGRFRRRTILGGFAALPVIALAGCGDDDAAPSPEAESSLSPTGTRPSVSATATRSPTQPPNEPSKTAAGTAGRYLPPPTGEWERADPAANGWSPKGLEELVTLVGESRSGTFMMLTGGRILTENYYAGVTATTTNDVASVQKSIASTLLGIAQEKRLLSLDDAVSKYLPAGWSKAERADEGKITIHHLMTMSSGLSQTLRKVAEPGRTFDYNTPAYQKTRPLLEKAAGMDINAISRAWLFNAIGVPAESAVWKPRADGETDATGAAQWGLFMTARDMARFGLLSLRRGSWGDQRMIQSSWYDEAWSSWKAQDDYGLLWWLMGKRDIPGAPKDWVAALGAKDQKIYVVPSLDLVVTRQGLAANEESEHGSSFDLVLFKAIAAARA